MEELQHDNILERASDIWLKAPQPYTQENLPYVDDKRKFCSFTMKYLDGDVHMQTQTHFQSGIKSLAN